MEVKSNHRLVGNENDIQNFLDFSIKYYKSLNYSLKTFLIYFFLTIFIGYHTIVNCNHDYELGLLRFLFYQSLFTILYLIIFDLYYWYISKNVSYFVNQVFNNYLSKSSIDFVNKENICIKNIEIPVGYVSCYMSFFANIYYSFVNKNGKYDDFLTIKY